MSNNFNINNKDIKCNEISLNSKFKPNNSKNFINSNLYDLSKKDIKSSSFEINSFHNLNYNLNKLEKDKDFQDYSKYNDKQISAVNIIRLKNRKNIENLSNLSTYVNYSKEQMKSKFNHNNSFKSKNHWKNDSLNESSNKEIIKENESLKAKINISSVKDENFESSENLENKHKKINNNKVHLQLDHSNVREFNKKMFLDENMQFSNIKNKVNNIRKMTANNVQNSVNSSPLFIQGNNNRNINSNNNNKINNSSFINLKNLNNISKFIKSDSIKSVTNGLVINSNLKNAKIKLKDIDINLNLSMTDKNKMRNTGNLSNLRKNSDTLELEFNKKI